MNTKSSSELNNDLLREYCYYLIEIILNIYDPQTQKNEIKLYRASYQELIEGLYMANSPKGLESVRNDLEQQVKMLGERFVLSANIELIKKFGIGISITKEHKKAQKIIEKGAIKNDKEYYFMRDYFEVVVSEQGISEENKQKIASLLENYGIKKEL